METDTNAYWAQTRPEPPTPDGAGQGRWADEPAAAQTPTTSTSAPQPPHGAAAVQAASSQTAPGQQGMSGSAYDSGYSAGYAAGRQAGLTAAQGSQQAARAQAAHTSASGARPSQTASAQAPQAAAATQPVPYTQAAYYGAAGAYTARQPYTPAAPQQATAGAPAATQSEAPLRGWHVAKWTIASFATIPALIAIELLIVLIVLPAVLIASSNDTSLLTSSEFLLTLQVIVEAAALLLVVPWYAHVCTREIHRGGGAQESTKATALRVLALVALGVGLQVVTAYAMAVALQFFPELASDYAELLEEAGVSTATPLAIVATVVLAPVLEESLFRGVALQFSLRAFCPTFSTNTASWQKPSYSVSEKRFWAANVIQALAFAIMHLNVVQGSYAFVLGLVLGWVVWRTGRLRWSMLLHAVFNASSYALDAVIASLTDAATFAVIIVSIALVVAGVVLLVRTTRVGDEQGKQQARG